MQQPGIYRIDISNKQMHIDEKLIKFIEFWEKAESMSIQFDYYKIKSPIQPNPNENKLLG